MGLKPLKPVDIVVGLRLAEAPQEKYEALSEALDISISVVHGAVRRLQNAGLLRPDSRAVNWLALREFLVHGVRYAFPAIPGAEVRGVPTAHTAPPMANHIVAEDAFVWPDASSAVSGRAIEPLYPRASDLPERCPSVYESLALVDALRVGRARERKIAEEELERRLSPAAA